MVTMIGLFSTDSANPNLDLEDFSKNNAPAIIFPYIREFVSNISSRTGLQPIILPPMNIIKMMKK
ncbi:TPA: hypothetical protein DCW38_06015 [candidate division WOR-3 bacterium]|jgi:preprotein translocase subunit SecB|uniref:Uncharacterized protein n=1 Tax=candidate division WOR-3 bacterium TaxID=2052148 RepID=A0A350HB03_UNCW3|nr:hypothetical protein [candidate division WOR-3 bacterium]